MQLFHDDIAYLLTMANLWKKRRPPTPFAFADVPSELPAASAAAPDKVRLTPEGSCNGSELEQWRTR